MFPGEKKRLVPWGETHLFKTLLPGAKVAIAATLGYICCRALAFWPIKKKKKAKVTKKRITVVLVLLFCHGFDF